MTTSPLITLSYEQLLADLTEIADADPDYEYPDQPDGSCMYFLPETGAPSCIIGHVLARHGVTLADLSNIPDTTAFTTKPANANISSIGTLVNAGLVSFTELRARDLARSAQAHQDMGETWGTAVSEAVRVVTNDYRSDDDEEYEDA